MDHTRKAMIMVRIACPCFCLCADVWLVYCFLLETFVYFYILNYYCYLMWFYVVFPTGSYHLMSFNVLAKISLPDCKYSISHEQLLIRYHYWRTWMRTVESWTTWVKATVFACRDLMCCWGWACRVSFFTSRQQHRRRFAEGKE